MRILGAVLLLGGFGHSVGVSRLYATTGVPDANRVLLDVWVAQAQFLSGGLLVAASRNARRGRAWQSLAVFGALTIIGFSTALLPVLIARAPIVFRLAPIAYVVWAMSVLAGVARSRSKHKLPAEGSRG